MPFTVLGLSLAALGLAAQAAAPDFVAWDLGGRAPAAAFGINPAGRTAGSVTPGEFPRAVVWPDAGDAPIELPMLDGTNWSRAFGINARGQIVGQAQDRPVSGPVQVFAVFWASVDDVPVELADGTLAVAVNDVGQIAGTLRTGTGELHAAFWPDSMNDPIDLGTLGGASSSTADMNDSGQLVGRARDADGALRAAFWAGPGVTPIDLGAPAGALGASANGINERGWIAGWAETEAGERHACVWMSASGPPTDLGTFGSSISFARGLNARGQIVGDSGPSSASRPVVWRRSP